MEIIGRNLKIGVDYGKMIGIVESPRMTVELTLHMEDIPNIMDMIENHDISAADWNNQKYRLIIEKLKTI